MSKYLYFAAGLALLVLLIAVKSLYSDKSPSLSGDVAYLELQRLLTCCVFIWQ